MLDCGRFNSNKALRMPHDPHLPSSDPAGLPDPPKTRGHTLPISFTGSGSEYFRIWVVNLLLILVTAGLYYPWAKVRRLRYFYGNTVVGAHPLDFHGDPKRMLRGFLLIALLLLIYSVAGKVSPTAGLVAFVILVVVWPALFRASQQFRLANTSWRGLRLRFTGDLPGAYRAMLPLFVPGLLLLIVVMLNGDDPADRERAGVWVLLATFAPLLLFPLMWWLLKKYQHDHYAIGQVQTELRTGAGSFYLVFLKTAGVSLLVGLCGGGIVLALLAGGSVMALGAGKGAAVVVTVAVSVALYAAMVLVIRPYATSRLQNLVWNRTKSSDVRFESALRFWPLFGLTLKNWLLVLLTLGMYWPFAAIATARLRLQAMTLYTRSEPDELVSQTLASSNDATGDAAGDLFGIDIGL